MQMGKMAKILGWYPHFWGWHPHVREILDPPLVSVRVLPCEVHSLTCVWDFTPHRYLLIVPFRFRDLSLELDELDSGNGEKRP